MRLKTAICEQFGLQIASIYAKDWQNDRFCIFKISQHFAKRAVRSGAWTGTQLPLAQEDRHRTQATVHGCRVSFG